MRLLSLKTAAALAVGIIAMPLAASTALADWDDQYVQRCDRGGDRCATFRCDRDGDDCVRVSSWRYSYSSRYPSTYRSHSYGYTTPDYYTFGYTTRRTCDAFGENCVTMRCDSDGYNCHVTSY